MGAELKKKKKIIKKEKRKEKKASIREATSEFLLVTELFQAHIIGRNGVSISKRVIGIGSFFCNSTSAAIHFFFLPWESRIDSKLCDFDFCIYIATSEVRSNRLVKNNIIYISNLTVKFCSIKISKKGRSLTSWFEIFRCGTKFIYQIRFNLPLLFFVRLAVT